MDNDINKYELQNNETSIVNVNNLTASKTEFDKQILQIDLDRNVTMINRFETQVGISNIENWSFQEYLSGRIINVNDKFIECECLISRDNSIFQIRSFEKSLFDNLKNAVQNSFVKIKLSQKPGSQRIDVIDGSGLGIEKDFEVKDDIWSGIKELEITDTPLR